VLQAVDAIAEVNPHVDRVDISPAGAQPTDDGDGSGTAPATGSADYQPDIVVLLTDGAATQGVDPITAAQEAADRKVRVYTIGFGTANPAPLGCTTDQLSGSVLPRQFGGGGGGAPAGGFQGGGAQGGRRPLSSDPETLQKIADITGATYHEAQDADQLNSVFKNLPNDVVTQKEDREISVVFAAIGGLAALAAVALSLTWNRYP
jgi:Ca-activated chloride channel family protein